MKEKKINIAVIGGGASGLIAAIEAKKNSDSSCIVSIFEKNDRVGRKILSTGNGRCNLGNNSRDICHYGGTITNIVPQVFFNFPDTKEYFRSFGLICREEDNRLYPNSNHASSVLDTLRLSAQSCGVDVYCNCEITEIYLKKNKFILKSSENIIYNSDIVIFSIGGYSAPALGTDGSAFSILKNLGIKILRCYPALCPIKTDSNLVNNLKGIRIHANVSLFDLNENLIASELGEVQFTSDSLSGVCVFNLAAYCNNRNDLFISIDLMPNASLNEVYQMISDIYTKRNNWLLEDFLTGIFQKKMTFQILKKCNISLKSIKMTYMLSKKDLYNIADIIKDWRFPVRSLSEWSNSQVTNGGVPLEEINSDLELKKIPNFYVTGEALDLHGACGGFNLNWAWASGFYVGRKAALKWRKYKL